MSADMFFERMRFLSESDGDSILKTAVRVKGDSKLGTGRVYFPADELCIWTMMMRWRISMGGCGWA